MNAEYVLSETHRRLAGVLEPRGFTLTGEYLSRETDGVRQQVGVALADFKPKFELSVVFGLRVHAAQLIFAQFWPGTTPDSGTCSFTLYDLAPEVGEQVVVRDKGTLESAFSLLIPPLEHTALPLLDSLRDAAAVERLFNGPLSAIPRIAPEPFRSMSAIILAHLARNPDRDQLMGEYRPRVERQGEDCLRSYDRLVEYLKGRALGEA